jgi:deoxyribose-phosphate aldolase
MLTKEILGFIGKNKKNWDNQKVIRDCLGFIDLTSLNTTDTREGIGAMVKRVNEFGENYPEFHNVAAICVYPNFVSTVKNNLNAGNVRCAAVAGVFPSSQSFTEVKILESRLAAENGADEIDIVISLGTFLSGDIGTVKDEIKAIKAAIGSAHLKVILESGTIADEGLIYKASIAALESGADFIKTSTGKTEPAATPEAAVVMCRAIKDFYDSTGEKRGFKPAGGIVTKDDAITYYAIVDSVLGNGWLNPEFFRIGASRLANNLLSEYYKKEIKYF